MTNIQIREIHIDAQQVSPVFLREIEKLGFFKDNFIGRGNGMELIPYHWTWQVSGPKEELTALHKAVFQLAVETTGNDFTGYVEAEVIDLAEGHQVALPLKRYDPDIRFPFAKPLELEYSTKNKIADVHCKVPHGFLSSALKTRMQEVGMHYVDTPKANRIYTMQFLAKEDSLVAFKTCIEYFRKAGGAIEITYEVCPRFFRKPVNHKVPACIKPKSLSYLY